MRVDPNQFTELTNKSHSVVDRGSYSVTLEHVTTRKVDQVSGHVLSVKESTYARPTLDSKEAVQEEMAALSGTAEARQKEMAVLSNSMSAEDFREYRENGGSISDVDSSEIVTVVDKIKIRLAESGADVGKISASQDAIDHISGGRVTNDQAAKILDAADLPATNDNVSDMRKAFELASSLTEFSDGAVKYMVDNALPAEIQNLYYAENGAGAMFGTETISDEAAQELMPQMKEVIEASGLPVNEDTLSESRWMVANEIALTEDNLLRVDALKQMELPFASEQILSAVTDALTMGKRPQEAEMLKFVSAERSLEETRLAMTEDANLSLTKRGMAIDTTALRERVEALKEKEQSYYEKLLTDAGAEADAVQLDAVRDTVDAIEELRFLPSYTLGIPEADTETLSGIREAGRPLKARLDQAGERYETMQTEVRRDLGDSIQKAFRNVDDIVADLGLPETGASARAVRILGYNSLEITAESVEAMKAKDEEVQRAFKNLTPAVVARMIRDGVNPLDMRLSELNERAQALREEHGISDEDRFSEYLYKLEHNREISPEERESYVGIYRLIHQIEKSDGAAIGAVVNQGAPLTMRNLLTAVRSYRKGGMDYAVSDDFDGVQVRPGDNDIIRQIDTAFQTNVMRDIAEEFSPEAFRTLMKNNADWEERNPEQFLDDIRSADTENEDQLYAKEQMERLAEAADTESEIYRMLEKYEVPNTVANVLALKQMTAYPNVALRRLFRTPKDAYRDENGEVDFDAVKNDLLRQFGEAVSEPEDLAKAQKRLADVAENVMATMLASDDNETTELDIRSMKMAVNRFRIAERMASEENYHIPVLVAGETGELNLKIVSGKEDKGIVDILFSLSSLGSVAAKLKVEDGKLSGFVAADRRDTVDLFAGKGEDFLRAFLGVEGIASVSLNPVFDEKLNLSHFNASTDEENDALRQEKDQSPVSTKTLYKVAKSFLSVLNTF